MHVISLISSVHAVIFLSGYNTSALINTLHYLGWENPPLHVFELLGNFASVHVAAWSSQGAVGVIVNILTYTIGEKIVRGSAA